MNYIDYNFTAVQSNTGAGLRTQFFDQSKLTIVSDEVIWHQYSASGADLDTLVSEAHARGEKAVVSVTPYTWMPKVGEYLNKAYPDMKFGTATFDETMAQALKGDVIAVDPYYWGEHLGVSRGELVQMAKDLLAWIDASGKESMLIVQGFEFGNKDATLEMIKEMVVLNYDYVTDFTAADCGFDPSTAIDPALWNTMTQEPQVEQPYGFETESGWTWVVAPTELVGVVQDTVDYGSCGA